MPLHFLRRLLAIAFPAQGDGKGELPDSTRPQNAIDCLLTDLKSRVPANLRASLQDAVDGVRDRPASGPELLDAFDRLHVGLGVAIGRGQTGEEQRHEQLGKSSCMAIRGTWTPTEHAVRSGYEGICTAESK